MLPDKNVDPDEGGSGGRGDGQRASCVVAQHVHADGKVDVAHHLCDGSRHRGNRHLGHVVAEERSIAEVLDADGVEAGRLEAPGVGDGRGDNAVEVPVRTAGAPGAGPRCTMPMRRGR